MTFTRHRDIALLVFIFLVSLLTLRPEIHGDGIIYFAYARSLFFDHDVNIRNEVTVLAAASPNAHSRKVWGDLARTSRDPVTGYFQAFHPIGSSLLRLPFYAVGHLVALLGRGVGGKVSLDGYSWPYRLLFCLGTPIYAFIGILLTYRIARHYFAPVTAVLGIAGPWWASPLTVYMYVHPSMSHGCDVFAAALFLFLWFVARGQPRSWKSWAWWGITSGIMVAVRPQNVVFLLLPTYEWGRGFVKQTNSWGWQAGASALSFGAGALLGFAPQMLAWKAIFGRYLVNSYSPDSATEQFSFWSPHFFDVLFSSRHGLFNWTPMILLGVVGWWFLQAKDRELTWVLLCGFVGQVYLIGSFYLWWAVYSFGQRYLIVCTPAFMLGTTALVERVRGRVQAWVVAVGILAFSLWNALFAIQFGLGLLSADDPISWKTMFSNQFALPGILWSKLMEQGPAFLIAGILALVVAAGGLILAMHWAIRPAAVEERECCGQ